VNKYWLVNGAGVQEVTLVPHAHAPLPSWVWVAPVDGIGAGIAKMVNRAHLYATRQGAELAQRAVNHDAD
jgi:hypothetical protein